MAEKLQRGGLGYKKSPIDIRDFTFKKKAVKLMSSAFPAEYECPVKTKVKNQGGVSSCVAHSAAEILEYHNPTKTFSTNFIYGIHKKLYGSNGPGMFLRTAAKIMNDYGDPEYDYCKGNTEIERVYAIANEAFINPEAMENAKQYRISKYARVSSVSDIKYALMNHGPVLGAIMWYADNKLKNYVLQKGTVFDGGHAIVVRGWNKDGWICQNSWGIT